MSRGALKHVHLRGVVEERDDEIRQRVFDGNALSLVKREGGVIIDEVELVGAAIDPRGGAASGGDGKFNAVLAWTAAYDLTWLDAGSGNGGYVEHRLSTGLTISR